MQFLMQAPLLHPSSTDQEAAIFDLFVRIRGGGESIVHFPLIKGPFLLPAGGIALCDLADAGSHLLG